MAANIGRVLCLLAVVSVGSACGRTEPWGRRVPSTSQPDAGGATEQPDAGGATDAGPPFTLEGFGWPTPEVSVPDGGVGALAITAGSNHACARISDGTTRCWGYNDFGGLGDGTRSERTTPAVVQTAITFDDVQAGYYHSCGRDPDGGVHCWGPNVYGALTVPTAPPAIDMLVPLRSPHLEGALQLALGQASSCALKPDGRVWCGGFLPAGDGSKEQVGPTARRVDAIEEARHVAVGGVHVCVVDHRRRLSCWGVGGYSEFSGLSEAEALTPRVMLQDVRASALGWQSACAVTTDETVWCWGDNMGGNLGTYPGPDTCHGGYPCSIAPLQIAGLDEVVQLGVGLWQVCALRRDGTVWCFGGNAEFELGRPVSKSCGTNLCDPTPAPVPGLSGIVQVAVGTAFACALDAAGQVWCWGDNRYGQLGRGFTSAAELEPGRVKL